MIYGIYSFWCPCFTWIFFNLYGFIFCHLYVLYSSHFQFFWTSLCLLGLPYWSLWLWYSCLVRWLKLIFSFYFINPIFAGVANFYVCLYMYITDITASYLFSLWHDCGGNDGTIRPSSSIAVFPSCLSHQ